MMLRRLASLLALCAFFAAPVFADDKPNPATKPAEKNPERHKAFLKDIQNMQGKIDLVFLGDSITDGWRGQAAWKEHFGKYNPLNLGIGGDRTQHVLWRIQHGELSGYFPKVFVIMIGTNNMGSDSEAQIADGVKAIIDEIEKQHPKAKILLLDIFPRSAKATDAIRQKVNRTNELLAKFDDGKTVKYLDIGPKFLTADGTLTKEIMPDGLHPNANGYKIWAESIDKELEEMLK
jgi:lysophospholipase L1-like esterase